MRHVHAFTDYYRKQFNTTRNLPVDPKRITELHPSSFPFCPIKTWYNWCMEGDLATVFEEPSSMRYYTEIGTAFHTMIQSTLGRGGKMLGDWVCPNCKHEVKLSHKHKCPKCKSNMDYEELGVVHGDRIVGHCDGLFKWGDGYVVIDYKTTSIKALEKHAKLHNVLPYKHNVAQIESYCYLLAKQYGIKIVGWCLMYCSRDNPQYKHLGTGSLLTLQRKKAIAERMDLYDTQYTTILKAATLKDLSSCVATKPCKVKADLKHMESEYEKCPLRDVCFSKPKLKEALLEAKAEALHFLPILNHVGKLPVFKG